MRLLSRRIARLEEGSAKAPREDGVKPADPQPRDSVSRAAAKDVPPFKVRCRFPALVEMVFVKPGQSVKRGDPLVTLHGPDLADAANDSRAKFVRWQRDQKVLDSRRAAGSGPEAALADAREDEKRSRVEYLTSLDKLAVYGMKYEQVVSITADLKDGAKVERQGDPTRALVRLTLTAPFDAKVQECKVESNDWAEPKDLLMILIAQ